MSNENTVESSELGLDARASQLLADLTSQGTSETAQEATNGPEAVPAVEESPPEQSADEQRKARIAARQAALIAMRDQERAKAAERASRRQPKQEPAKDDAPAPFDAASFFIEAEKRGVTPEGVAAWLNRHNDPTHAAEFAAKKQLTPFEQKLEEQRKELAQLRAELVAEREQQRLQQLIEQNTKALHNSVEQSKEAAPLTFALLKKQPAMFRTLSNSICDALPDGFTAQDVIDYMEENLLTLQLVEQNSPASTQQKPKSAKATAQNVGNRIASERATTVDPSEEDDGDLETRAARLKARLSNL
jgi:hypothetical protein